MNENKRTLMSKLKQTRKSIWLGAVSLLVICLISLDMWWTYQPSTHAVPTAKVQYADINSYIISSGEIDVDESIALRSAAPGLVTEVLAEPGSQVKAGTALVRLDGYSLAQSNYETIKKKVDHLEAISQLAASKMQLDEDNNPAKAATLAMDQAAIHTAEKQLELSKTLAADTENTADSSKTNLADEIQLASQLVDATQKLVTEAQAKLAADKQDPSPNATAQIEQDQQEITATQQKLATARALLAKLQNQATAGTSSADQATIDQAKGTVAINESALEQAKAKLQADSTATDDHLLLADKQDDEQAQQALEDAKFELKKAKLEVDQNQVLAPVDGLVVELDKKIGDRINAYDPIGLLVPANPKHQVIGTVSADDVASIAPNSHVTIESAQFSTPLAGVVRFVSPIPKSSQNENLYQYQVYVDIDALPANVRSGMAVKLKINTKQTPHIKAVPVDAVMEDNGKRGVYVQDRSKPNSYAFQTVEIGTSDDKNVEVKGLSIGTVVALKKP